MSSFETPTSPQQYERDLRSAHVDYRRNKTSVAKWAHGCRPKTFSSNCVFEIYDYKEGDSIRPVGPYRSCSKMKTNSNIVKANRGNSWYMPTRRVRNTSDALREIDAAKCMSSSEAMAYYTSSMTGSHVTDSDILYSYDNTDTPPPALTLDAFVKPPTVRATEKMVEKEYEVLDGNGDAVKGRKARQVLRTSAAASSPPTVATSTSTLTGKGKAPLIEIVDEEDFELV